MSSFSFSSSDVIDLIEFFLTVSSGSFVDFSISLLVSLDSLALSDSVARDTDSMNK